jgi:DNA replication and repair protein RecF
MSIRRFRNLRPVELHFSPQLNLFVGENAAGKTSLLESLFVLARGRSFRATHLDKLIQSDEDSFELFVELTGQDSRRSRIGMRRRRGGFECRIDARPAKRLSELAALLPVHWLGGNLHALIEDGPAYRRQFLDWGLFHVKPDYMALWKRFGKLLKQRNAALRAGANRREVRAWEPDLAEAGDALDSSRRAYLDDFEEVFADIVADFPTLSEPMTVSYRKGWDPEVSYRKALDADIDKDIHSGFTRAGPHRAELSLKIGDKPAADHLSHGQQKVLVAALQLAQASLLHRKTGKTSLFLMDDLGSELDAANRRRLLQLLSRIDAQVFVTAIEAPPLSDWGIEKLRLFHVKHGVVSEVVYSAG